MYNILHRVGVSLKVNFQLLIGMCAIAHSWCKNRSCGPWGRMRGNMGNENQKCPMCSTKLKMIDGRMTCKSCGYYFRNDQEQQKDNTKGVHGGYQNTYPYQSGNTNHYGNLNQPNGDSKSGGTRSSGKNYSGTAIAVAIMIGVIVSIILGVVGVYIDGVVSDISEFIGQDSYAQSAASSSNAMLENIVGSVESSAENVSGSSSAEPETSSSRRIPRSTFFIQAAEAIWGKGFRTITAEEYASLTALKIDTDEKTISFQLDHGNTQVLIFQNYKDKDLADLASFPGLEFLSIDDELYEGDLDGLNHLNAVYAENSITEMVDIIPDAESIVELGIKSTFFEKSLEGLEAFPNLEYLSVDYDDLEDISILEQYPDLRGLTLEGCDSLTDYSPLMALTNMEVLKIASSQLKSIDFVKQMPNLTHLRIEDSKITGLEALRSCPNLRLLSLVDNYSIVDDDYSVVGEMEMLEDLTISLGHLFELPSFAKLTKLLQLSLKNVDDPTPLKDAVNVKYLELDDISWWDLNVLTSMENLSSLKLTNSHLNTLEPLTQFSNLMLLDLEGTNVYGNVEEIFGIPSLYYLNMKDCKIGLDFDRVPVNEMLLMLDLSELTIMEDPSFTSQNRTEIYLSSHYEFFENFPNVTELYLKSLQLDSIEFVKSMPNLEYLDITDNNVTSLKPLEALEQFRMVSCGRNTILENVSADSGISVSTAD